MKHHTLNAFLTWAEEYNVQWDKDAIEIRECKHGLGIFAKKNLDAGYEAIQVPKSIVLSVESTGIANLLEEEDIEGYAGLTLACMYEYSQGAESVWSSYLALLAESLPQMPSDLSGDARELLKKSEVYGDIETDLKDMQEDYDTVVLPFLEKHPEVFTADIKAKFFSFEDFKTMTSHVSSRAMDVDNFHISALVPFADIVNHNSEPNSDYLTHEEVCEVCGAISCEHMDEDDEEEDDEEAPELAGDEDKKKRTAAKKAEAADEDDEDDDEEDEDWEDDINDTCDIVLDDDVKKGEEITRHYGPFPNKIFLSKYGFAEVDNEHDTVTVQIEMVKKAAESILGDPVLVEERTKWFLETEDIFIGEDDEDELEDEGCCDGDHDHDHDHGHSHAHGHAHAHKQKKEDIEAGEAEAEESDSEDEESDDEAEEEDFPRDIMEIMHDGSIDDRLLMLLNVLFMDKEQFVKVEESVDAATEYFNDIFLRRAIEEDLAADDEDSDEEEAQPKPELKPLDDAGRRVRKNVLEAILQVIRLRADAYDVSDKTTAEDDMELLNKAGLSGTLYYGALCVIGEKKVLQNALKTYSKFQAEL